MTEAASQGFRLSPLQRRLWLVDADGRRRWAHALVWLQGALDRSALERAVAEVVARHESLRTVFRQTPGLKVPAQVIVDDAEVHWRSEDLRDLPEAEREARIARVLSVEEDDVSSSPTVRSTLFTLAEDVHVWHAAAPVLLADAASLSRWIEETAAVYASEDLAEDPFQFLDVVDWREDLREADDEEAVLGRSHWSRRDPWAMPDLAPRRAGEPDAEDATDAEDAPAEVRQALPGDLIDDLAAAATAAGVGQDVWLQACWMVLVGRSAATDRVTLGRTLDGRKFEELEDAIGWIESTVPVEVRPRPGMPFLRFVEAVRDDTEQAREWQELYLPPADAGAFPVVFQWIEVPEPRTAGGLTFLPERLSAEPEPAELRLVCHQGADRLDLEWRYDPRRFRRADVEQMARSLIALVTDSVAHPRRPVELLDALGAERREALSRAPRKLDVAPRDQLVHRLFVRSAHRAPDDVAVVCGEKELTYRELDERSLRFARALRSLGVGTESVVGLHLERSERMLEAVLGVLRAGGCYLPLDATLPEDRIAGILDAAGATLVVGQGALCERLPDDGPKVVSLESLESRAAGSSDAGDGVLEEWAVPESAAYVQFTSGSTGEPKGVVVEHRHLANYVHGVLERLDLPAGSDFAFASTFGADLGNTAVFPSLATGGRLHVLPAESLADADALMRYFEDHPVDCLKIVPSHLAALLAATDDDPILPRRCLVLGGEALTRELVEDIRSRRPELRILNHYGPTETTVGVLTHRVEGSEGHGPEIPLGEPLANCRVHLLADSLEPVPPGAPGEIVVGGDQVTRGYRGRAAETAERYRPDPFPDAAGGRVYRTGDKARHAAGRGLLFQGRIDDQLKIRGFRVEPGEVRVVLETHADLREAVVVGRQKDAETQLVAYVVPDSDGELTVSGLRGFLQPKLPEHMVPSVFVTLDALPRNANGKVDRSSLPDPEEGKLDLGVPFVAPRSDLERTLTGIWEDVLDAEKIGVQDNFFDLGGTSLSMLDVHRRVQRRMDTDVEVVELFQYPTIEDLAGFLADGAGEEESFAERSSRAASRMERLRRQREVREA